MELYIVELNSYRGNSNDCLLVNGNEDGKMFVIVSVDLGQVVNVDDGYDSAKRQRLSPTALPPTTFNRGIYL